jgi:hypothetical protein
MRKKMSKKSVEVSEENSGVINSDAPQMSWEAALAEAEKQLRECKIKSIKLKAAIMFFKERLESGEPFPGQDSGLVLLILFGQVAYFLGSISSWLHFGQGQKVWPC